MDTNFFEEPLRFVKKPDNLRYYEYAPVERHWLTDTELFALPLGSEMTCDVECFSNYFLVGFKHLASNSYVCEEATPERQINTLRLRWLMQCFLNITFNGNSYDMPLICKALRGAGTRELKALSDELIFGNDYKLRNSSERFNHIDLIEVAPLQASLKLYAGRLHCRRMQELSFDPHSPLTKEQAAWAKDYNCNDLDNTQLLREALKDQIELRSSLGRQYGEDLRSKSDAQIAETVIASEFAKIKGYRPKKKRDIPEFVTYNPPAYLSYNEPQLKRALEQMRNTKFAVNEGTGYVETIEAPVINLAKASYRMSIGGLHSSEEQVSYKATADVALIDRDVTSYYPAIILNGGLFPDNLGEDFLTIYKSFVDRRTAAKKAGDESTSSSLKITINGTFGKLGSPYSILYAPELMLHTTLTGQLSLLLLIEWAVAADIEIISANTDGVVFRIARVREAELATIIHAWEQCTGFATEETRYAGYFARDVNNYIAVKESGEAKAKGAYSEKGSALNSVLSKNPECLICSDAVKALLARETPIEQTVRKCRDIRRFVAVRNVKGGAHKDGVYLGRAIRWYYARGTAGAIHYVLTGNKVPKTDGARALMELPAELPADLNHDHYIAEAMEILRDVGYYGAKQISFF